MTALPPVKKDEDAAKAIRFLLLKSALFIGIPMLAAIIAAVTILWR